MIMTNDDGEKGKGIKKGRFVIHEKKFRTVQHLLRLEMEGVLKCWMIVDGMPESPDEECIAVEEDECTTRMLYFSGLMRERQKTPAKFKIEDSGKYEILICTDENIEFILNGKNNSGKFILFKSEEIGPKIWILQKLTD
ncbi:hypothetical protein J2128_002093 [Methanomicrobium sp. W14]|uniref:DNA polymerase ligase N-terminal domain-containing protein n=1 Tax=Methanomicrobium sp. W14 TaxID=2817839 RepID=UPI001AE73D3A|nr:DNA polymerase ligase N-terminal domain-containing protein [Methanomicrobium sp. W14]MBP2134127.1 hypothetical protein [Methanomicrobium sp. W14]